MGRIAGQLSDYVIITSDNPRFEDPQAIVDMVVPGVKETGVAYEVELDRVKAIEKAVSHATAGDMIVLAGKGHEDYQIIGAEKIHCDDREIVRELLKKRWHKQY